MSLRSKIGLIDMFQDLDPDGHRTIAYFYEASRRWHLLRFVGKWKWKWIWSCVLLLGLQSSRGGSAWGGTWQAGIVEAPSRPVEPPRNQNSSPWVCTCCCSSPWRFYRWISRRPTHVSSSYAQSDNLQRCLPRRASFQLSPTKGSLGTKSCQWGIVRHVGLPKINGELNFKTTNSISLLGMSCR